MYRRRLGSSEISVSAMGLGCMGMSMGYGPTDDAQSLDVIHRALDLGVTLFDTADIYGPFTNETVVGKAISGHREGLTLSTKGGQVLGPPGVPNSRDGSPAHLKSACDASLMRLGVDVIDVYSLHRVDPNIPIEESVGAMGELVAAGKVRALGLSEVDVPTLERAMAVHRIAAVQSELSLWTRDALDAVLPWCVENDVAFVAFAPLGRGFLTGKYRSPEQFDPGDFRRGNPRFQQDAMAANMAILECVEAIAGQHGVPPSHIALAWVLAQGEQVIPIPGTKKTHYLEENLGAVDVRLTPEELAMLDDLPSPVGSRY